MPNHEDVKERNKTEKQQRRSFRVIDGFVMRGWRNSTMDYCLAGNTDGSDRPKRTGMKSEISVGCLRDCGLMRKKRVREMF